MSDASDLGAVKRVANVYGSGVPIIDRRGESVDRPCAMAMLVAFLATAETFRIARYHARALRLERISLLRFVGRTIAFPKGTVICRSARFGPRLPITF